MAESFQPWLEDEFATAGLEAPQIGVSGVECARGFLISLPLNKLDLCGKRIPFGILVDHVTKIAFLQ